MNYHQFPKEFNPVGSGPPLTVPDQSMSVREIFKRYAQGQPLGGVREELWYGEDEEDNMPDPRTLDLSEIEDITKQSHEFISKVNNDEKERKSKAERARIKKQIADELNRENQAAEPETKPPAIDLTS